MKIKVFECNENGKIEFFRFDLEKLLNEVYQEGYDDGSNKKDNFYYTAPHISYKHNKYYRK